MKIVYVMYRYTTGGGIERVISLKANYLVSKGYEVTIIACFDPQEEQNPFFYFDPAIQFIPLGLLSIQEKHKKQIIQNLTEIFQRIKPDIVISVGTNALNCIGEIKDGSKKIIEYHFSRYKRKHSWASLENSWPGRFLLKLLFLKDYKNARHFDRIIVLTEEDKKSRMINNFKRIDVIPNPISFRSGTPAPLSNKKIIAIGRLTGQKGFDRLIKIWEKVAPLYPDWEVSIFGDGRKKKNLEKQIKRFHLEQSVSILPPTPNIQNEIFNSSILVSTSRYEGLPMILLESFACGVPAVAYAYKCGPKDLIENGVDSFYSKVNDKDDFIENLKQLIENKELRNTFGKKVYEKSKNYEIDKIMEKWITVFKELVPH